MEVGRWMGRGDGEWLSANVSVSASDDGSSGHHRWSSLYGSPSRP